MNNITSRAGTGTELELKTFSQTRIVLGSQQKVQSSHMSFPTRLAPDFLSGQPDDSSGIL